MEYILGGKQVRYISRTKINLKLMARSAQLVLSVLLCSTVWILTSKGDHLLVMLHFSRNSVHTWTQLTRRRFFRTQCFVLLINCPRQLLRHGCTSVSLPVGALSNSNTLYILTNGFLQGCVSRLSHQRGWFRCTLRSVL